MHLGKGFLGLVLGTAGVLATSPPAMGQCPQQVTVADNVYNADGSAAEGRVVITWPTFQAGACQVIAGQLSVNIAGGVLNVPLYPNDASTPSGTSYRATYHLKSGRITTEYWVVPSGSSPVPLSTVRSSSVPVPTVVVSQGQVTNLVADLAQKVELPPACPAGKFLQASGAVAPPQVACVDGTGAPLASSVQSGTVRTDVDEADPLVYTRQTADGLLAAKAPLAHSHTASDLAVVNPSGAQLSGVGDNNIAAGALSASRISGTAEVQSSKGMAGGYPSLNGSALVVENPANAQVAPGASKIPVADGAGKLNDAWLSANVSLLGSTISLAAEVTGTLPLANRVNNKSSSTPHRCVRVNSAGTALEAAGADCGAGGGAPASAPFVVAALDSTLTGERRLQGTANRVTLADGGANGDLVLDVGSEVATSSSIFTAHLPLYCTNPRVKSGTGNAFFDVEALTTGDFDIQVAKFNDGGDGRIICFGRVPNELAATPAAAFIFDIQPHAPCGASQNFRVNVRYRFWGSGSADTALTAETAQNLAGSATAHALTRATFPASGNLASAPAAGNNIVVEIQRDGAHASDNCAQVMEVLPLSVVLRADLKVKP